MSITIIPASQRLVVKQLVFVIYGQPGIGKSTLACTTDKPLVLDFDKGAHRSGIRRDTVTIRGWQDVQNLTPTDLKPYKTLVIDTVGRCLESISHDIIRCDPKAGNRDGQLTRNGYGSLKGRFHSWLSLVTSYGLDIVLVAHATESKNGADGETVERLDIPGSSKDEVYKCADAMGRMAFVGKDRRLNFSPTDVGFGKNPGGFEEVGVPGTEASDFLANIIEATKGKINGDSIASKEASIETASQKSQLALKDCTTAEQFNEAIDGKTDYKARAVVMAAAKEHGFLYSTSKKAFMRPRTSASNGNRLAPSAASVKS